MKRLLLKYASIPAATKVGLVCTVLSCLLYFSITQSKPDFLQFIDSKLIDIMFTIRGPQEGSGMVVIVDIDDKSIEQYGQWPWPKDLVAKLTEDIIAANPVAIGFDLMFSETNQYSQTAFQHSYERLAAELPDQYRARLKNAASVFIDSDKKLADILKNPGTVQGYRFLFQEDFQKGAGQIPYSKTSVRPSGPTTDFADVQLISAYRAIYNIEDIRNSEGSEGFINLLHDQQAGVRKAPLFLLMDNIPYPSLAMAMVLGADESKDVLLHIEKERSEKYFPVTGVSSPSQFYPTDPFGQITINYRGPTNTFLYLSARDVMSGAATPFLADKYVLVSSTASGTVDLITTPYSSRMPGAEVHATILDNLIQNDPLVEESNLQHILSYITLMAGGITLSIIVVFLHPILSFTMSTVFLASLGYANYNFLFLHQKTINISAVLFLLFIIFLLVTLCSYFFEGKKRTFIRRAFSHYVSPEVVNELMRHPEKLDLLVDSREVTVLFCDIRNFTQLAESVSPAEISLFLNNYFSLLTEIIIHNNGMVDKYIGDAIMAVWGTPLDDKDHAIHGVRAALEMVEALETNREKLLLNGTPVQIGIGINSGMVSAGNFGCKRRFDYTVLGDTVNLASRVEDLTKHYPTTILITQFTREKIGHEITSRLIDTVQVKGRIRTVDVYEPLQYSIDHHGTTKETSTYDQAIALYKKGDFNSARSLFEEIFSLRPDPLYNFYIQRCRILSENPPTEKWSGISRYQ